MASSSGGGGVVLLVVVLLALGAELTLASKSGVAGKPTTTVAMFSLRHSRENAAIMAGKYSMSGTTGESMCPSSAKPSSLKRRRK